MIRRFFQLLLKILREYFIVDFFQWLMKDKPAVMFLGSILFMFLAGVGLLSCLLDKSGNDVTGPASIFLLFFVLWLWVARVSYRSFQKKYPKAFILIRK